MTAQTLMKLNPSPPTMIKNGEILLNGKDIVPMNKHEMKSIRGREISMIFQDPMTSLNPTQRIGKQIEEAVRVHETVSEQEARQRAISMLEKSVSRDRKKEFSNIHMSFRRNAAESYDRYGTCL